MPLITSPRDLAESYDFVIIGGGTAGLALAARLTEDPSITVLVLEAGNHHPTDPAILIPGQYGHHFGNPEYDWAFKTVPQEHAGGKSYNWPRGKGLGGSSAINFLSWTLPPKREIDDWEKLGNPGWNWEEYEKYALKIFSYTPRDLPIEERERLGQGFLDAWGKPIGNGPLKVGHPKLMLNVDKKVQETLVNLGIPYARAPLLGDPAGTFIGANSMDPSKHVRTHAGNVYFEPNSERPNFAVLISAYATRLGLSEENSSSGVIAEGVYYTHGQSNELLFVKTSKEVILSAGALKSPQLLELSGIGRTEVLESVGIPVRVPLEGVGENTQEHNYIGVSWELKADIPDETFDILRNDPTLVEKHVALHKKDEGVFTMGIVNFSFQPLSNLSNRTGPIYDEIRTEIEVDTKAGKYGVGLVEQYKLQLERLEEKSPCCELIGIPTFLSGPNPPSPGKRYYTMLAATNHPWSRGTVHITSKDPKENPAMDPHYFEKPIDLRTMIEVIRFVRRLAETKPFSDFVDSTESEVNPGLGMQSDKDIGDWIKEAVNTTYHTVGSLSMLPREKGGVVDSNLKVYGTKNIRVVDISVIPLHISAHTQTSAYIIGEKAADIIRGEH